MDVEDIVAGFQLGLEILDVNRLAHGAGSGERALAQFVVESLVVVVLTFHVRVVKLAVDGIGHGDDNLVTELLRKGGSHVAIGVGNECQHNINV